MLIKGIVSTGILRNERGLRIVMYHRFMSDRDQGYVVKQSVFKEQIALLKSRFTMVVLDEFLGKSIQEKADTHYPLAITVDDGYRSFFDYAYPILKENHIGATLFLPYDFIENGTWMWQDKNKYILKNTRVRSAVFQWRGLAVPLSLDTFEGLMEALDAVYDACLRLSMPDRQEFSEMLARSLDVPLPDKPAGEFVPMTWDQIKEMERYGIAPGSHTVHHETLPFLTRDEAFYEMNESKTMIEDRLGHPIQGFCFPNGNYNEEILRMVGECGYTYAVTTQSGHNEHARSLFELRRIGGCDGNDLLEFFKAVFLPRSVSDTTKN